MHLGEIWRYPVKSMGGERLAEASIGPDGVEGDRIVTARDAAGRLATARRHPRLLRHRVALTPSGEPVVDGLPWSSEAISREVERDIGPGARLARSEADGRFDILPLLVATDGSLEAFGHDPRRLRPNLVIAGVDGLAERDWEGRTLRIGEALVYLDSLRGRCVMTTIDPDSNAQDPEVLAFIARRFGGRICLNASIRRPGRVREGDPVVLMP